MRENGGVRIWGVEEIRCVVMRARESARRRAEGFIDFCECVACRKRDGVEWESVYTRGAHDMNEGALSPKR